MIVFDSSTLILLAKADLLDDFLDDYRGRVLLPREVEVESCGRKETFDAILIRKRIEEKKLEVAAISNLKLCISLMSDFRIQRGEAEALVLALERKAKLLATDDRNTIKACKLLKIPFTSAIAVLLRMAEKGTIDLEKAMAGLEALSRFGRYSDEIISDATKRLKLT